MSGEIVRRNGNIEPARIVGEIKPLKPQEREAFPHVVFEREGWHSYEQSSVLGTYAVLKDANFPFAIDIEGKGYDSKFSIRSSSPERDDRAVQSALFLGLSFATERASGKRTAPHTPESIVESYNIAHELYADLVKDEGMVEAFKFYGGLRWSTDQERFIKELFEYGTEFDEDFLDANLDKRDISELAYELEIPYESRKKFDKLTPAEVFEQVPEMDYRRLEDEEFRDSPEGQAMERRYARMCGEILARQHKDVYRQVTADGKEQLPPPIPLTKHPIVEALVIEEVDMSRPRAKYSFGAKEVIDMILNSDSVDAHKSLVSSISRRLPEEQRHVFDGPNEFEYKRGNIGDVLRAYNKFAHDEERRAIYRDDVIALFDNFAGERSLIKNELRTEALASFSGSGNASRFREIVSDMVTVMLAAPDAELVMRAETLVESTASNLPATGEEEVDPLAVTRVDLTFALLDSFRWINAETNAEAYKHVATLIFGDETVGDQFRELASMKANADALLTQPHVLLAFRAMQQHGSSLLSEKPEKATARDAYDRERRPGDDLLDQVSEKKNNFIVNVLSQMANSDLDIDNNPQSATLFRGLVNRVDISLYEKKELPDIYHGLMTLAKNPNLEMSQRSNILWHLSEKLHTYDPEGQKRLAPVVLDMYEVVLGQAENVQLPSEDAGLAMSAIVHLIGENRGMFKGMPYHYIETMAQYKDALIRKGEQELGIRVVTDGNDQEVVQFGNQDPRAENISNITDVLRRLGHIEEYYREHLHIQEVKEKPHMYYPWVLNQMQEFRHRLQWEVGPGNRPSADLRELYDVVEDHVTNKFVFQEKYSEDFDVMEEGSIDSFLKEGYYRMVKYSDLHYNNAVWQSGMPLIGAAMRFMPETLLDRMTEEYQGTEFGQFLEKEKQSRRADEERIH